MAEEQAGALTKALVPFVNGQLVPKDFDGVYRIANIMANSGMVPAAYAKNTEMVFVAMQMGYEVGLSPMMAVQNIAVIEGKPVIYADGITGLLQASSDLENIEEYFEVDGERKDPSDMPLDLTEWPQGFKAVCIITRKGRKTPYRGTFSVADAMRMEKWGQPTRSGKKSVWMKYPARMLTWRARTFAARDGFSDVLKGLKIYEEVADYTDMEDTNGKYEVVVPEAPGDPVDPFDDGFKQFCADICFDDPGVRKFVELSAKTAGCEVQAILDAAYNNVALFKDKLSAHVERDNLLNPESGQESGQNVQEDEKSPFQDPDMDKVKEDIPAKMADKMADAGKTLDEADVPTDDRVDAMSTPRVDLNGVFFAEMSKLKKDPTERDYIPLLDNYIEYVVETINSNSPGQTAPMSDERLIESWLNDGELAAFVEFFLSWIESEEMKENESATPEGKDRDIDPVDEGATSGVETKGSFDSSAKDEGPESPKTFIKDWAMMPGPKFKMYVEKHPENFEGISSDEYSKAREKWVKLVYAREKIDWPLDVKVKQDDIKFPDMNPRQQLVAVRKKYPDETKKAMEFRGMAQHVTTDDAASIVIADIKTLVAGGVLVK